jgi:capsular exopolysaccharide synthesis family protein
LESDERNVRENLEGLKRQLEAMGRIGTDEDEFTVVQAGTGNAAPVGPDRPRLILSGAGAGLGLAIALIFLLHRLDDRVENPEEIEAKLEEPILGQLPEVDKRHNTEGYLLLTRMKPHTMFAEALRGVRSALLLGPDGASKRLLAVTSAVPGDGKTTFTTNFAATLAAAGNRTLLVDADLRRGNIHNYFEQPLEGGLTEVLEGRMKVDDAIHETQVANLWLMRAGERPSNPSELLLGARTKELIGELRGRFDYVVFDCPPLTAIDDTFSIAAYLDGLLFVVRAGRTSIRFARLAINTIRQRGAPLVGLVVNGVPIDNPYYYYTTYYYASYYHKPLAPNDAVYADRGRSMAAITAPDETRSADPAEAGAKDPAKK